VLAARLDGGPLVITKGAPEAVFAGARSFPRPRRPKKADAGTAVAQLAKLGVDVKIITGDNGVVAATVCREIGIDVTGVMSGAHLARARRHRPRGRNTANDRVRRGSAPIRSPASSLAGRS